MNNDDAGFECDDDGDVKLGTFTEIEVALRLQFLQILSYVRLLRLHRPKTKKPNNNKNQKLPKFFVTFVFFCFVFYSSEHQPAITTKTQIPYKK